MNFKPTLDADIFSRLKEAAQSVNDVEILQSMQSVDGSEFKRFVANEVENPRFRTQASEFDLADATQKLQVCQSHIESSSVHEVVAQLYTAKLKNQQLRYDMLDAVARIDDVQFGELSIELYGRPSKKYFAMIVEAVLAVTPQTTVAEAAHRQLCNALKHVAKPAESLPTEMLPPHVEAEEEAVSAAEVADLFRATLADEELPDWSVVVDDSDRRARFSVNPYIGEIYVPSDTQLKKRHRPLTRLAAKAIAAHEISVHAKRAAVGMQQPLQLLSIGLDSYLRGEEGLASYAQQQIEGADGFYGQDRYFAVALALGLDGEPRDFRAVFSMMLAYYQLLQQDEATPNTTSVQRTWEVCQRIFRGTSGCSVGSVYTRDIAYFEGNVGIWNYIVNHPERYSDFFIGKFDPLNDRHVTSLQTLEILPQW